MPDVCKFQFDGFRSLPAVNVRRCLRRRNITSIVTVGDSNAARYYSALLTALVDKRWRCVKVKSETIDSTMLIPDIRYFARHDPHLLPLLQAAFHNITIFRLFSSKFYLCNNFKCIFKHACRANSVFVDYHFVPHTAKHDKNQ